MRIRNWILVAAVVVFSTPALAVIKVYNATPPGGTPGDGLAYTTTLCPPLKVNAGIQFGNYTLSDTGGGSVSMLDFVTSLPVNTDFGPDQLTTVFGPGAFVFVNARLTVSSVALPHSAAGSSAPFGSVAWGVISGWKNTGSGFCTASPQTICTSGSMLPHGETTPLAPINSTTYDLGTWSFDAAGDMTGTPYITRTSNGGTSNSLRLVRGAYVGAAIPALPLVGAGALAIGFLIAGTRSVLRKK